jgi:hypothetical protein
VVITAVLIAASAVAGAVLVSVRANRLGDLADARSAALNLSVAEATRRYERLLASPWTRPAARAGTAITRSLAGDVTRAPDSLPPVEQLVLRRLLHSTLVDGSRSECQRLAEIAVAAGDASGHLYAAALALLAEPADVRAARAALDQVPEALSSTRLARRVQQALPVVSRHGTVLRDRRGLLIGAAWTDGTVRLAKGVNRSLVPPRALMATENANSTGLRLSIDLELARAAAAALEGWHGTVVLVDVRTGELLAAVSDPQTAAAWRFDAAFRQRLEPASIMKIVTVAAALRRGLDADAELAGTRCTGALRVDNSMLWCPSAQGLIHGLNDAFAASCNTAFARLGLTVGRHRLLAEHRLWGFEGGGWAGRVVEPRGNRRQLADLAIGLNATDITPIHAALLAVPVATGTLPKVALVHAADSSLGLHPEPISHPRGQAVLDRRQRRTLLRAMDAVTSWSGTAALVDPPGFQVAMKTGTGGNRRPGFHVNYIGFGPLPDPWLAFSVRVTGVPVSRTARRAGYQVTQRMLRGLDGIERQRRQLHHALEPWTSTDLNTASQ